MKDKKLDPLYKKVADKLIEMTEESDPGIVAEGMADMLVLMYGHFALDIVKESLKIRDIMKDELWAESVGKDISGRIKISD